jgi:hypothetical protein
MYQKQLRFGGRPFTQSRFGPCLAERKGGARKVGAFAMQVALTTVSRLMKDNSYC